MKFCVSQTSLHEKLKQVCPIVEKQTILPVLTHVRIEADDDKLVLTTNNLELAIQVECHAQVNKPGKICLPAQRLNKLIGSLPEGDLVLELNPKNLRVKIQASSGNYTLVGLLTDDFPEPDYAVSLELTPVPHLWEAIHHVLYAAASDSSRFNLSNVALDPRDDGVYVVSTDGHRLARVFLSQSIATLDKVALIPQRTLQQLKGLFALDEEIDIGFSDKYAFMITNELKVRAQIPDVSYPDYKKIIPEWTDLRVLVDSSSILRSLKRLMVLNSQWVDIKCKDHKLVMSSQDRNIGEAVEQTQDISEDIEIEVRLNPSYLQDAVSSLGQDKIVIDFTTDQKKTSSPVMFSPSEGTVQVMSLIMPMRQD